MSVAQALRMACLFGFFQGLMPLMGWMGGKAFTEFLAPFDHWVAFILLALISLKLFHEAWEGENPEDDTGRVLTWKGLLVLSIATSIDALAAGLSFSVLYSGILIPVIFIGVVAAIMSLVGVLLGKVILGRRLDRYAAVLGGLILLGIGIRILVVHISSGI